MADWQSFLLYSLAVVLLADGQVLNSRQIGGSNICTDPITRVPRCCEGWTTGGGGSWNCNNPLCRRGCGDGRCISPNLCACPDGRRASTCPETPSCPSGCKNGGTCIGRNRCRCPAQFGGNLCQTNNCPRGCMNGGRCVGKNRCMCPKAVTGERCETDNRVGPCYREIRDGTNNQKLCANVVPDVLCSRCLCCQTVGLAWGRPCQQCPQVDAEKGRCVQFQPINDTYMDSATLRHGDRHLLIVGNSSLPGAHKRSLLKYDVSSLTRCSLIRSVHVNTPVNSTKNLGQGNSIAAHRVLRDWQESAVSSRYRTSDEEWVEEFLGPANQPPNGVDAEERAQGTASVTAISLLRRYTPEIKIDTQTVCDWIANPRSSNKGLLLRATCENASCGEIRFNSRESKLAAPELEVCLNNRNWRDNDCTTHICPRGKRLSANRRLCEDIDECEKMPTICGQGRGRCINTDGSYVCECNRGFTKDDSGACRPPDLGYCYRQITHQRCSQVLSTRVSKSLCCNLVGEGWGMESCSHIHECSEGDRGDGECKAGFYLNNIGNCEDINECVIFPTICRPYGACLNTHGAFKCLCNVRGFVSDITGTRCIDTRPGQCWGTVSDGRCRFALGTTSLSQCCCSVGKSWGNPCQLCPPPETAEFDSLCVGGRGYLGIEGERDIDECREIPGMCRHGYCVNSIGSYRCYCPDGFELDHTGTTCIDVNECSKNRQLCGRYGRCVNRLGTYECHCSKGYRKLSYHTCVDIDECRLGMHYCRDRCVNVPGAFRCECAAGYYMMPNGLQCRDINECFQEGICDGGRCYNTPGSYQCVCNAGFRRYWDKKSCRDINECAEMPRICLPRGSCFNTPGSYRCVCEEGYEMNARAGKCQDVDECRDLGYCQHGRCINYPASFQCTCPDAGYVLDTNGTHCLDVNECELNSKLCTGGTCANTVGSYSCSCPSGYTAINDSCMDIDECAVEGFCQDGTCTNTMGNYSCVCREGYIFNLNTFVCIDTRRDYCYLLYLEELNSSSLTANETGSGPDFDVMGPADRCLLEMNGTLGQAECCCTLGVAWGRECNQCPQADTAEYYRLCGDKGPGRSRNVGSGIYVDINECTVIPGMCDNGYCINTFGSYRCACDNGYQIDDYGYQCVDVNECETVGVCGEGRCVNMPGSFNCTCPDGYQMDDSGSICYETRIANCHMNITDGEECGGSLAGYYTKSRCCCSAVSPEGFGTDSCVRCPRKNTDDYRRLCARGPGIGCEFGTCDDINECELEPGPCINGRCVNLRTTFRCECASGYELDFTGRRCVDVNECNTNPCNANADCVNLDGGYRCYCPPGFEETDDGRRCVDVNECIGTRVCLNGVCRNEVGTYSCSCNAGFELSYSRKRCDDIDECSRGIHVCTNACNNTAGSYTCECPVGTRLTADQINCEDVNECTEMSGICGNGNCANVYGSFHCYCPKGYTLDHTGRNCINVDECSGRHDCRYSCTDSPGSYVCGCPEGYTLSGDYCLDINECYRYPGQCGDHSRCVNTPGSYRCECARGYQLSKSGNDSKCIDVDECVNGTRCGRGRCLNRDGSFRCECPSGLHLHNDVCYDRNCTRNTKLCPSIVGRCKPNRHVCRCNAGYRYDRVTGACLDINECVTSEISCPAACQNTPGSYRCPCPPGMVLSGNLCLDQPLAPCIPGDCVYDCVINPTSVPVGGVCGCAVNEIPEAHENYTLCIKTSCTTGDCSRKRRSVSDKLDEHEVVVRGNQPAGSCFLLLEPGLKKHHGQIEMQLVDEISPHLFYLKEDRGVWSVCLREALTSDRTHEIDLQAFYLDRQRPRLGEDQFESPSGPVMNMKIHVLS